MFDGTHLPTYDPIADLAKKERARVKLAENAVHLIPFVLIACALILWLFSNPGKSYLFFLPISFLIILIYWLKPSRRSYFRKVFPI